MHRHHLKDEHIFDFVVHILPHKSEPPKVNVTEAKQSVCVKQFSVNLLTEFVVIFMCYIV